MNGIKNFFSPRKIIPLLAFIAVGVFLIVLGFKGFTFKNTEGWIDVTGTIVSSGDGYTKVSFVISGITYFATLSMSSDSFKAGNAIALKVNPNDYSQVVVADASLKSMVICIGGIFALVALGVFTAELYKTISGHVEAKKTLSGKEEDPSIDPDAYVNDMTFALSPVSYGATNYVVTDENEVKVAEANLLDGGFHSFTYEIKNHITKQHEVIVYKKEKDKRVLLNGKDSMEYFIEKGYEVSQMSFRGFGLEIKHNGKRVAQVAKDTGQNKNLFLINGQGKHLSIAILMIVATENR